MDLLVSYGEIALKGKYVRNSLEKRLVNQIRNKLLQKGYNNFKINRMFGRIHIQNIPSNASFHIANIFGVVNVMPVLQTDSTIESVLNSLLKITINEIGHGETFAIRPKVVGSSSYTSRDISIKGGNLILEKLKDRDIRVNLENPDVTCFVEVRGEKSFIYTKKIPGFGGLPYGSQGKLVSMFSGGIDSPVATWLMMKRGASVLPLFMDQTPHIGKNYLERVQYAFKKIKEYVPFNEFNLYVAYTGTIMDRILENSESRFNCVLCKRSMYRISEKFAEKKNAKGIITGESLGQVASQTLDNLYSIEESVNLPIFRPLIGFDKVEIEVISRKIGTYELTAKSVDGCNVVPQNPSTTTKIEKIKTMEKELSLFDLCYEVSENIKIKKIL